MFLTPRGRKYDRGHDLLGREGVGGATKGPGRQNPEIDRSILGSLLGTATDFSIDFFPVLGVGNTSCCPSG